MVMFGHFLPTPFLSFVAYWVEVFILSKAPITKFKTECVVFNLSQKTEKSP